MAKRMANTGKSLWRSIECEAEMCVKTVFKLIQHVRFLNQAQASLGINRVNRQCRRAVCDNIALPASGYVKCKIFRIPKSREPKPQYPVIPICHDYELDFGVCLQRLGYAPNDPTAWW